MFSFFRRRRIEVGYTSPKVEELRARYSPEQLKAALLVHDRVIKLRSVDHGYFDNLMNLTDRFTVQFLLLMIGFQVDELEANAFCASVVATAIDRSDLPGHEKPTVIDIYLGIWSDTVVEEGGHSNSAKLKTTMDRLWREYAPSIIKVAVVDEPVAEGEVDPATVLLMAIDQICGFKRADTVRVQDAKLLKARLIAVVREVHALAR